MRKFLVSLVAAIALFLGLAAPSDAFVLAPYEYANVTFGTCQVQVSYGNYGSAAYATMTEYSTSRCMYNTSVLVGAVGGGQVYTSPWCSNYMRLSNPYPNNCSFSGLTTMAFIGGSTYGGAVYLCYYFSQSGGGSNPTCNQYGFGPWG